MSLPLQVVRTKKNKNGFTVATVHYSMDPEKNNPEWISAAKRGLSERAWNREYEIDYTIFAGKPFFPEFNDYNIRETHYFPRQTIYRGWDYGFHRPACLITVLNQFDQWCWLEVILGKDEGIMEFGKRVREHCLTRYPGAYYVDAGDPAGEQVSDKSEKTSVQILQNLGIFVRSRKQPTKQGSEIIRQKLPMRVDGKPGILINPDQTILIDGFKGGLHYPDVFDNTGQIEAGKVIPEHYQKDGFYDHCFDAGRYIATEMFTVIGEQQMPNALTFSSDDPRHQYRMGGPGPEARDHNEVSDLTNTIWSEQTNLEDFF